MSDDKRHPSEQFKSATQILREPLEHASTPALAAPDMTTLKARAFQCLLEAARDNDLAKLLEAVSLMADQTSPRDLAHDLRRAMGRQYGP